MESKLDLAESSTGIERTWQEIPAKRSVSGADFTRGVIDFDFSIGGRYGVDFSKSYFRVELKLESGGVNGSAVRQPHTLDKLAFADNPCAGLFDNVYMRIGGTTVSSIINYAPQAHQIKNRLGRSRGWMNGVGKEAFGFDPYFTDRTHAVSSDGLNSEENTHKSQQKQLTVGTSITLGTPVATATTAAIVGIGTAFNTELAVGDTIVINNTSFPVTTVTDATNAIVGCPAGQAGIAATTDAYVVKPGDESVRANTIYMMYQPPCGIFDHEGLLGSGEYRIQLNPNTNYAKAIVQAIADKTHNTDYTVTVQNVRFYACVEKSNLPASGTTSLYLTEQAIQTKTLTSVSGNNVLDFTVPPSTQSISVGVIGQTSGSDNREPSTALFLADRSDTKLANLQLTYANKTVPSVNWESDYGAGLNQLQQRYINTQLESGQMWNDGGETFKEWLERGPLYHQGFERDSEDRSTNLQINVKYNTIAANSSLVVCAHYSRRVDVTTTDGRVTNVVQLSV
jgi:hypothetical protein